MVTRDPGPPGVGGAVQHCIRVQAKYLSGGTAAEVWMAPSETWTLADARALIAEKLDRPPRLLQLLAPGHDSVGATTSLLSEFAQDGCVEFNVVVRQVREVRLSGDERPTKVARWTELRSSQLRGDPELRFFTVRCPGQSDVNFTIQKGAELYYLMHDYCELSGFLSVADYEDNFVFLRDGEYFDCHSVE
mmetsp:Transcript_19282/g.39187  ORF Transcript_19282/g.39187 Transcript_19282/m.39187 type:complete len:190 (+) Transcript_19282:15-584(+)